MHSWTYKIRGVGSTNLKKGLRLSKIRGEPVKTKTVIEGMNVYVRCGMVALQSVFFFLQ